MFNLKRKEKFDKYSYRGIVYVGIALLGIGYELLFSDNVRPLLILAYGVVFAFGIFYIWYIKPYEET